MLMLACSHARDCIVDIQEATLEKAELLKKILDGASNPYIVQTVLYS
jgi:hypothetical protein